MMHHPIRRLFCVWIAVLALAVSSGVGLTTSPASATSSGPVAAATTSSVDDAMQGTGQDQFHYVGSGWGHASGEGAPANPYDGTNSYTNASGATVSFPFTGTQITFYGVTDPGHGIGALSLDGGASRDVDFYSPTRKGDVALWTSPTLANGPHTLTLAVTGRKNPASTGTYIVVDRVSYIGQPPPPVNTDIPVALDGPGRVFDGVGAISGGGQLAAAHRLPGQAAQPDPGLPVQARLRRVPADPQAGDRR